MRENLDIAASQLDQNTRRQVFVFVFAVIVNNFRVLLLILY